MQRGGPGARYRGFIATMNAMLGLAPTSGSEMLSNPARRTSTPEAALVEHLHQGGFTEPHYPYDSQARFLDTRIYPSRMLNALLLGQNYHLIHHLWTTIPWYRYQRVFHTIRPELETKGSRIGWTVEPRAQAHPP